MAMGILSSRFADHFLSALGRQGQIEHLFESIFTDPAIRTMIAAKKIGRSP